MTGALTVGCYDEKYRGMDSAEVFNMLKQRSTTRTVVRPEAVAATVSRHHNHSGMMRRR